MEEQPTNQPAQFSLIDILLLMAGCSFALAVIIPVAGTSDDGIIVLASLAGMTLVGWGVSYSIWRFLPTRWSVLAVNLVCYSLLALAMAFFLKGIDLPVVAAGPLSLLWRAGGLKQLLIGLVTAGVITMISASSFRLNLVGALLTSLGCGMWFLAGLLGLLAGT